MKTTKKALLALVCAAALVFGSVFATYAYLTSTTDTVTNTFTVGNVTITLDEAAVDANGEKIDITEDKVIDKEDRRTENAYKLVPGVTYAKDPTVHIVKGSEECYVFVKVTNGLGQYEAADESIKVDKSVYKNIAKQMDEKGWKQLNGVSGVYYLNEKVNAVESKVDIDKVVFTEFMVANTVNKDTNVKDIVVEAYAVQAAGFETAAKAWEAAPLEAWTKQANA